MIDIAGLRVKLAAITPVAIEHLETHANVTFGDHKSRCESMEPETFLALNDIAALLNAHEAQAERITVLESEHIKHGGIIHDCHEFIRSRNLWLVFCEWLHRRPTGDA